MVSKQSSRIISTHTHTPYNAIYISVCRLVGCLILQYIFKNIFCLHVFVTWLNFLSSYIVCLIFPFVLSFPFLILCCRLSSQHIFNCPFRRTQNVSVNVFIASNGLLVARHSAGFWVYLLEVFLFCLFVFNLLSRDYFFLWIISMLPRCHSDINALTHTPINKQNETALETLCCWKLFLTLFVFCKITEQ